MLSYSSVRLRPQFVFCLALLCVGLTACVTDPFHNKVITNRATPVQVQAFTIAKEKPLQVQCRPYLDGGAWTTVATLTSGSTPSFQPAQGDLYIINGSVVIPNNCWYHWHSQYTTELRFLGGPYTSGGTPSPFSVYDRPGVDCLVDKFFDGVSYTDMMSACRLKDTAGNDAKSIYVHAGE